MTDFRRRALITVGLVALALTLAVLYRPGYRQLQDMKTSLVDAEADHQRLEADHARLSHEVDRLQQDPLELEGEARRNLGLVRPGEVIYKFPPAGAAGPGDSAAAAEDEAAAR